MNCLLYQASKKSHISQALKNRHASVVHNQNVMLFLLEDNNMPPVLSRLLPALLAVLEGRGAGRKLRSCGMESVGVDETC